MKLLKLAVLSLTISCITLFGMKPGKTEKVKQYSKILKKLSAEDKSKYKSYFNCIPDIQRVIQYYAYLQALDEADSLDKHCKLLVQIRELKEKYNDSQVQQHPYSFVELEKLANKAFLEDVCGRIKHQKYQHFKNEVAQNSSDQNVQDDLMRYAVNHNDIPLIKAAAYLGAGVNARLIPDCHTGDMNGLRPIFLPYLHQGGLKVAVAKALLDLGADVNKVGDHQGLTPLHQHIIRRNTDLVKLLIERGANVNAKDSNGNTPLFSAVVYFCRTNIVKMLLEAGADKMIRNNDGKTIFDIRSWWNSHHEDLCSQELQQVFDEFDKEQSNKRQKTNQN